MKLPLSVLMYQLSDDYGYETVNVDVSSEYDGIKLFDEGEQSDEEEKYLYLIEDDDLEKYHDDFKCSSIMSSSVFICICPDEKSAVCTNCRDLSVVFLYADVKFAYIFNKIQNIVKRFDMWEKSFHLSMLRRCSMQELVDITEDIVTHPLLILDNNYSVIAHTRKMNEVGPLIKNIINNGYASPSDMHRLISLGMISDLDSAETPEINRYKVSEDVISENDSQEDHFYSITYKFTAGGKTAGYAVAYHCLSHPTNGYLYLMNMLSEKLQLFFEQEKQGDITSSEAYQTFLAGIMSNPEMSERQMKEQAGHIPGLETEGEFILAQLQYNRMNEMSYSFISWSLRHTMPQFMPFAYRDSFYILKNCTGTADKTSFINKNEEAQFFKCFNNIDFSCGVSEPFFSLSRMRNAANQCREAMSIGISLEKENFRLYEGMISEEKPASDESQKKYSSFYKYKDIEFFHVMMQLKKVMPLESIESPYYRMLKKYDEENSADLCELMARYIICGCSVTGTAAATYMHRNTILNKVKKAANVMNDPLDSFTAQVFFLMSYMNDHVSFLK